MRPKQNTRHTTRRRSALMPMFVLGGGLMLLGFAAIWLLPKPGARPPSDNGFSAIPAEVDYPAPVLRLTDLDNNPVTLADWQGQWVLVNNWATWCPPCRAEMPTLQAFYTDHQAGNFALVAINAGEDAATVKRFVDEYGLSFTVWLDLKMAALDAFRNDGLPNSYLIDPQGRIRLQWTGEIDRANLDAYVAPLIEGD